MAIWKYCDNQGNWKKVGGREIVKLAASGIITPGTAIETPDGKTSIAKNLQFGGKRIEFGTGMTN